MKQLTSRAWRVLALAFLAMYLVLTFVAGGYFAVIGTRPPVESATIENGELMVAEHDAMKLVAWHEVAFFLIYFVGSIGSLVGVGYAFGRSRGSRNAVDEIVITKSTKKREYIAVGATGVCLFVMMHLEGLGIEALINVSAFMGVIVPSFIWVAFLSRHVPADRLFLQVWKIPLWLGIITAIIGIIVVLAHLGEVHTMEDLGGGVAVAIIGIVYGIVLGPLIFLPIGLARSAGSRADTNGVSVG